MIKPYWVDTVPPYTGRKKKNLERVRERKTEIINSSKTPFFNNPLKRWITSQLNREQLIGMVWEQDWGFLGYVLSPLLRKKKKSIEQQEDKETKITIKLDKVKFSQMSLYLLRKVLHLWLCFRIKISLVSMYENSWTTVTCQSTTLKSVHDVFSINRREFITDVHELECLLWFIHIYRGLLECNSICVRMACSSPVGSWGNMGTLVLLVHCVNKTWQPYLTQERDNTLYNTTQATRLLYCLKCIVMSRQVRIISAISLQFICSSFTLVFCINAHNWFYYDMHKCTQTYMQTYSHSGHTFTSSHTGKAPSLSHIHKDPSKQTSPQMSHYKLKIPLLPLVVERVQKWLTKCSPLCI